jgi:integration host factor subunit beta
MTKQELIKAFKKENGMSGKEATTIVDLFINEMTDTLSKGQRVEIRGFCSFYVKDYKAYAGRNPKTGERLTVAPKKMPFFKCSKELKERVDYQGS